MNLLMFSNDNNMGYMEFMSKTTFDDAISLRTHRNRIRAMRLSAFLIESRVRVENTCNITM